MARPLRLEYAGALYHVTSRGDHSEAIYRDARDRIAWQETLQLVCQRFNFHVHAYCQMSNHYHVLLETVEGNLAQGMRQLNGIYTQCFNRRHGLVGHLFQGRYKAILVQKETHLLELARYIVLNPVRANLVKEADAWPWSSHMAMLGRVPDSDWIDTDWLLSQFGEHRERAIRAYAQFVREGRGVANPLNASCHRLILGDNAFIDRHRQLARIDPLTEVIRAQRRVVAMSIEGYAKQYADVQEAMAQAYYSTMYTMEQIGRYFRVSSRTVNRAVKKFEASRNKPSSKH